MKWVYIHSETDSDGFWLYTVGFYKPDGTWVAESDHDNEEDAAARVHYLNGGEIVDMSFRCAAHAESGHRMACKVCSEPATHVLHVKPEIVRPNVGPGSPALDLEVLGDVAARQR